MEWDCGNAPSPPNSYPTLSTAVRALLTFSNFLSFFFSTTIFFLNLYPYPTHLPFIFLLSIWIQMLCYLRPPTHLFFVPLLSFTLSPQHLYLFSSSGIACLIFCLCGGPAGWIRAWTGPTNHPDLQDSFSITSPMLFHLYKYTYRERAREVKRKKRHENNREG